MPTTSADTAAPSLDDADPSEEDRPRTLRPDKAGSPERYAVNLSNLHVRCIGLALVGVFVGVAANAYGQDAGGVPLAAPLAMDPTSELLTRLVAGGGLPAVLGLLAFFAGRGALQLPVTVQLHVDDRKLMRSFIRAIAASSDEPPTNPGVHRRRDDDTPSDESDPR